MTKRRRDSIEWWEILSPLLSAHYIQTVSLLLRRENPLHYAWLSGSGLHRLWIVILRLEEKGRNTRKTKRPRASALQQKVSCWPGLGDQVKESFVKRESVLMIRDHFHEICSLKRIGNKNRVEDENNNSKKMSCFLWKVISWTLSLRSSSLSFKLLDSISFFEFFSSVSSLILFCSTKCFNEFFHFLSVQRKQKWNYTV